MNLQEKLSQKISFIKKNKRSAILFFLLIAPLYLPMFGFDFPADFILLPVILAIALFPLFLLGTATHPFWSLVSIITWVLISYLLGTYFHNNFNKRKKIMVLLILILLLFDILMILGFFIPVLLENFIGDILSYTVISG